MIKFKINQNKDLLIVFISLFLLFIALMYWVGWQTDLPAHVQIAIDKLENKDFFSGNFLMYTLLNVFTGFSGHRNVMKIVLCVFLAFTTTWKYFISKEYLRSYMSKQKSVIISISLLVIYIVPVFYFLKIFDIFLSANNMYLGYYVPNVWHNSTIIFLFPFAVLLYLYSNKQLIEFDIKRNILISILVVLNVFIKPSFFFVFIIIYPFMLLSKYGLKRAIKYLFLPVISGFVSLFIVYSTIYNSNDGSSVAITFEKIINFEFWLNNGKYLLMSLLFPVLFFSVYYKKVLTDFEFWYLLGLIISSIGIYFMCIEVGPRATHGNFYWQIVITMWLVFFYISKMLFSNKKSDILPLKQHVLKIIYFLHVIMGLVYISKILITQNFG